METFTVVKRTEKEAGSRPLSRICLFFGQERYLVDKCSRIIIDSAVCTDGGGTALMNVSVFEGKSIDVGDVMLSCDTLPFFAEYRVVIIKNSGFFATGKKDASEAFYAYADSVPDSTIVVFIEENVDKRSRLYKRVSELGFVAECQPPKERELLGFIADCFARRRKKLQKAEILLFLQNTGSDMLTMESECGKLCDFAGEREMITADDIENVCIKTNDAKVFELIDAIGNKKLDTALNIYNSMLGQKESPLMILAMLGRHFKMLIQCRYLAEKGWHGSQISEETGIRDFLVNNLIKQSKNFADVDMLVTAFLDCQAADTNIKSGKIGDRTGVEALILKYGA